MNSLKKFGFDTQREPKCLFGFFSIFLIFISPASAKSSSGFCQATLAQKIIKDFVAHCKHGRIVVGS